MLNIQPTISAKGNISVQPYKSRIVLNVSDDFVDFYYWLISTHYWIRMNKPLHGAHITIFNDKLHTSVNWKRAMQYDKKEVEFTYDPYIIEGGYHKGFLMYYIRVFSDQLDKMKAALRIEDSKNYKGLHLTIANGKNESVAPVWPKMIEIRK